ncbi:MAG: hypothetical protein ACFE9Z_04965 [Promethearchaeota archaeon]
MDKYIKEQLSENLELILFDKTILIQLKKKIEELEKGFITSKELRQEIINSRVEVMNRLLNFFPFFLKSYSTQTQLQRMTEPSSHLLEELEEKNKFLEDIGTRINTIYKNLIKDQ